MNTLVVVAATGVRLPNVCACCLAQATTTREASSSSTSDVVIVKMRHSLSLPVPYCDACVAHQKADEEYERALRNKVHELCAGVNKEAEDAWKLENRRAATVRDLSVLVFFMTVLLGGLVLGWTGVWGGPSAAVLIVAAILISALFRADGLRKAKVSAGADAARKRASAYRQQQDLVAKTLVLPPPALAPGHAPATREREYSPSGVRTSLEVDLRSQQITLSVANPRYAELLRAANAAPK